MKTNIQSLKERINNCCSAADCDKMEESLTRLFQAGVITAAELRRYGLILCDKRIALVRALLPKDMNTQEVKPQKPVR